MRVAGSLRASPKPGQALELVASALEVVGGADASFPLQKKAHSAEFLRSVLHLRAKGAGAAAVLRLRGALSAALHAHLQGAGLLHVHAPVLTGSDCEGAGEQFAAAPAAWPAGAPPFFGRAALLSVSAQLHLEAAAQGLSAVYAFGPTFRAENSNTSRHLAEFWMLEPEVAPGDLEAALALCQGAVAASAGAALGSCSEDLRACAAAAEGASASASASGASASAAAEARAEALHARLRAAAAGGFARLTYTRALALLNGSAAALPRLAWGADLPSEHERWLAEVHVQGPVFVTHYPASLKPFYMRRTRGSEGGGGGAGATVENFDLLVPGLGELAGGSAREEDVGVLGAAMAARGLLSPAFAAAVAERGARGGSDGLGVGVADPANGHLDWYLDLRRYGGVRSAGWGLGFERLVAWAAGLDNVRDAAPFPRARNLCSM